MPLELQISNASFAGRRNDVYSSLELLQKFLLCLLPGILKKFYSMKPPRVASGSSPEFAYGNAPKAPSANSPEVII